MFYRENRNLGLSLMTIMQLMVDVELIAMGVLWYLKGTSFRYPIVLTVLGVSKILLNVYLSSRILDTFRNQTNIR